jgi:phosphate starvation-inducible PhoH-like protein
MAKKNYPRPEKETFVKALAPKNSSQDFYLSMIKESTVTFGVGPAGTGKTFLACHAALEALSAGDVDKLVLTRPVIATEEFGILPGDMHDKIHPFLMPLFDAIEDHLGVQRAKLLFEKGQIEILPLAFMRGRSLNRSIMILDEAQNTNREQMKMFLTRLGYDSKMIITGDPSQSDLPRGNENGLSYAVRKLKGISSEIAIMEFASRDIVRNPLIGTILQHLESPDAKTSFDIISKRSVGC